MTYIRRFSKTIRVPVKVELKEAESRVDYNGNGKYKNRLLYVDVDGKVFKFKLPLNGQLKEEINVDEVVDINVCVDTDEYDKQSVIAANNVALLTDSVVATESAQVKSIHDNAQEVATTIVKGFFSTVKSDISAKITEQHHRVEALLMHLKTQSEELNRKQLQMENDYHRTAARYTKICTDLNNELENRVKQLDLPVYTLQENVSMEANRMLNGDFASIASVVNKESLTLNSQIQAASQRKKTVKTIDSIQRLLFSEQITNNTLSHVMTGSVFPEGVVYLPVCFAELEENKGVMRRQVLMDAKKLPVQKVNEQVVNSCLMAESEYSIFRQEKFNKVLPYLQSMVQGAYQNKTSVHDLRVKSVIVQMFKNQRI